MHVIVDATGMVGGIASLGAMGWHSRTLYWIKNGTRA